MSIQGDQLQPQQQPPPKRRRTNNNKQKKKRQKKKKQEEKKQTNAANSKHSKRRSRERSRSRRSPSRSHSLSRSSSRVFSLITDEDILRQEIKKPNLNRSDFQEMEELGGGDFSAVELAVYVKESKYVALKILDKKSYQRHEIVPHAFSEKHMLKTIDSPFKIKYLGSFQTKKYLFLVTEYVEGCRLIDLIQEHRGLDEETCRFYAAQLVLFLETLHHADAIFRDLKPENVLVSHWDHYLKVVDFGYSAALDKKTGTRQTFCGTLEYLCPEKIQGLPYGAASDIWSFGVLLFVMLCNKKLPCKISSSDLPRDRKHKESNNNPHNKDHPKSSGSSNLPQLKTLSREVPGLLQLHFKDRKQKLPLSNDIQDLIASMLAFRPEKRPTISQIKKHAWFHDMDWDVLQAKKMVVPPGCFDDSLRLSEEHLASSPWKDW